MGRALATSLSVRHASTEAELAELRSKYIPRGITSAHPITADRAKGSELWDVSGKRYIDFAGGIGVMNVGHAHPRVMRAVQGQLERATHTSFQVVHYESYLRLAERLCQVAPIAGAAKAIDRKSTRLNSSHGYISYAVFCLKKKKNTNNNALSKFCIRTR